MNNEQIEFRQRLRKLSVSIAGENYDTISDPKLIDKADKPFRIGPSPTMSNSIAELTRRLV